MVIKACCHVSSVKHKSLVHYLNACLLLQRCHFLILQYSKHSNCYNFLFAKFFSHNIFIFKTCKCNHQLPCLHGKLLLTERLLRRGKEAVFTLLGPSPITEVVHRVETCLPKCLNCQKDLGWNGKGHMPKDKPPSWRLLLGSPDPSTAILFLPCSAAAWRLHHPALHSSHIQKPDRHTAVAIKSKFILGWVPA